MRAFEERPDALDAVGVDISDDPLLAAVRDRFVPSGVRIEADVGAEFVGVDRLGLVAHGAPDKILKRVFADVGDPLDADPAAALDGAGQCLLPL